MNRSKSPNITKSFEKKSHNNVKINFHKSVREDNVMESLRSETGRSSRDDYDGETDNLKERKILGDHFLHPEDKLDSGREKNDLSKFGGFGGLNGVRIKDKVLKGEPLKLSKCDELPEETFHSN